MAERLNSYLRYLVMGGFGAMVDNSRDCHYNGGLMRLKRGQMVRFGPEDLGENFLFYQAG